jgi:Pyruvate/2-oxoacid:ferredoxin oxidoreductase delta subunit
MNTTNLPPETQTSPDQRPEKPRTLLAGRVDHFLLRVAGETGANISACYQCERCTNACPFGAPFINADHVSEIPPSACRGCGICVCECPAQAIALRHARDEQLNAAIDGLLEQSLEEVAPRE